MWVWEQDRGRLRSAVGKVVGVGYAGAPGHINRSLDQSLRHLGPIPCGRYTITPPIDTRTHGPFVLWLEPDPANQMFGRSAFGIHGDSVIHPGSASQGCIVLPRSVREAIWASQDHRLEVRLSSIDLGEQMEVGGSHD